jgi:uncharacterized protein YqfA (UPF0365 family)
VTIDRWPGRHCRQGSSRHCRTNLDRFVGGATEETIIGSSWRRDRYTIGSASYKDVWEPRPHLKDGLDKALDSNTAFEILSIDIADIDVGENVGANCKPNRPKPTSSSPKLKPIAPRRRRRAPSKR